MAAQTKFGHARRLADGSLRSGTAIWNVTGSGHPVIPQRRFAGGSMRRMAEAADVRFRGGSNCARAASREIVFGRKDGIRAG
jgi:hypothetical protein